MANGNGTGNGNQGAPTLRSTLMSLNPKIVLAFFNIIVAALLTVFFTIILVRTTIEGKTTLDPGTIALLAGFITTFILMAKSGSDYQFSSSAGSDKKDDTSAEVAGKLADKFTTPTPPAPTVPVPPWWSRLQDGEKNAITAAVGGDPRVAAFVTASQVGAATPDDLAYLVGKGLLTQDRADLIKAV